MDTILQPSYADENEVYKPQILGVFGEPCGCRFAYYSLRLADCDADWDGNIPTLVTSDTI